MKRTAASSLVAALLLASCAENAVLEVELTLPPRPAGQDLFAYVQARSADTVSFDEGWAGDDAIDGRELEATETVLPLSIVAGGGSLTRELGIRVRFCTSPDCTDVADDRAPEVRYRIERAFYLGQRTRFHPMIDTVPAAPPPAPAVIEVDKCEIEGCTSGSPSSYCFLNGNHFCEE